MTLARQREAEFGHFGAEERCIGRQPLTQRIAIFDEVEDLQRGGGNDRRQRVGEEIGARALAQPLDHLGLSRSIATGRAAERLAERTGDDVDTAFDAAMFGRAATMSCRRSRRRGCRPP